MNSPLNLKYIPEHTFGAYSLAMRQGVDWIEPDICLTSDGIPICMHDWELSKTTNVASFPQFANRRKTVILPSGNTTGWFTDDFTLAEIKSLRVNQRLPNRDTYYNGLFQVPTLDEALKFLNSMNANLSTNIGIYIEPKHPSYFQQRGLIYDDVLIQTLERNGFVIKGSPETLSKVIIECFESSQLQRLRPRMDVPFIQLVNVPAMHQDDTRRPYWTMMTQEGLANISTYAQGIGPFKFYFYPFVQAAVEAVQEKQIITTTTSEHSTELHPIQALLQQFVNVGHNNLLLGQQAVNVAHQYNLLIHPWTARNKYEDDVVNKYFGGSEEAEYAYLYDLGIDGIFTESAGAAICARKKYMESFLLP